MPRGTDPDVTATRGTVRDRHRRGPRPRPGRGAGTGPARRGRRRQRLRPARPRRLRRGVRRRPPRRSPPRSGRRAAAPSPTPGTSPTSNRPANWSSWRSPTFGKLDILVNNAGILRDRMVFSMTEEEWDSVIRVHLKGHFNTTRFAAAHWRERSKAAGGPVYGRIVNTSSEAFLAGSAGQPNYAAAKGGIVGLTTSTALALAKYGVTANVDLPARPHPDDRGRLRGLRGAGGRAGSTRSPPSMSPRSSATWPHPRPRRSTASCSSCTAAWSRSSNGRGWRPSSTRKQDASATTNWTRCSPRTTRTGRRGRRSRRRRCWGSSTA